jgi:DNA-3-methyladenine glycosylase II
VSGVESTKTAPVSPVRLTPTNIVTGLEYLASVDQHLAVLYTRNGSPPLWERATGFPTLVHIILEQQVSLASARAAFTRLQTACGTISPTALLSFDDQDLKTIGFSRQKASYCRGLAQALLKGDLNLEALAVLPDHEVRRQLLKVKGIGPWTAEIYLLMVLLRPDSWPIGDLALAVALQDVKGLTTRPSASELESMAQAWKPWRALAARLLWHDYLIKRGIN